MSIYEENGYLNRNQYLQELSEEYGVDIDSVVALATVLGKEEDFDGLVSALEDI